MTRPEHTMHSNENWVRTEIITRFYTCEKTRWAPCEKNGRQLPYEKNVLQDPLMEVCPDLRSLITVPDLLCKVQM